ncbi:MAG: 4Fe-4S dicluster domain-containing protein [Anaerovoracaceae bacterium]|jgi:[FeFe] hydrogenase (group B1/B3)
MNADWNLIKLRHQVLYEVAKLAFEGTLDEKAEFIPEKIIPGTIPTYRCCVYKEREIVRQRVRLSLGKAPGPEDDGNLIQVIAPACADCPISSYLVTENCQNCVGKACINSCRFGAITPGKDRSEIDRTKCKECGQCAKACPYNAIVHLQRPCKSTCPVDALTYEEDGLAIINKKKCIQCGICIHSCPFGAIGVRNAIVPVIEALKSDRPVYAMIAPATEGQYGKEINLASWKNAAKALGFVDLYEVGLGADLTTAAEAEEWYEAYQRGEKRCTSCCPAFVNMIRRHFPEIQDMVSTAVSPMCQLSRLIKHEHPDAVTVFIGPCIAKKSEVEDQQLEGNVDYALIYSEFEAIMRAKEIKFEPSDEKLQEASTFGKRYANAGGVADSCIEYLKEQGHDEDFSVLKVSGARELKKTLGKIRKNGMEEAFMEGMSCEGGCFYGPSSRDSSPKAARTRETLIQSADDRTIHENLEGYDLSYEMHDTTREKEKEGAES